MYSKRTRAGKGYICIRILGRTNSFQVLTLKNSADQPAGSIEGSSCLSFHSFSMKIPSMNVERTPDGYEWADDDSGRGRVRRAVAWGVSLLPVVLGGCLFLSWVVSLLVPAWKYARPLSPTLVGGVLLYLAAFSALFWLLRKTESISESRVVWGLIGLSFVIKLILVLGVMREPLHADQALFHHFVCEMADHRLDGGTMSALSEIYDYPVWAGRVLPVHYAIRFLAGGRDVLWTRLLNIVLSSAILLVTYGFSCRLLPKGRRKWAVFLMMALPFQSFVVTDYSHHLFSAFYFLLGMWCAWDLVFTNPGLLRRLGLSVLAGLCLLLMMWQRGVHIIALGVWTFVLLWAGLNGIGWRRWGMLLLGLGVLPLLLSIPTVGRFDEWLSRHDAHQLNSILPAFVARGWCPESAGEYCGRYEQLDRVTPWPEKNAAMFRLVLSQIRYNTVTVCVRFPVIKTAKLFLVGYAANFEESLEWSGSPALPWVRGMRLAGAPIFLGLAIWGCLGLAVRPRMQSRWLIVFLAPLLTWGAYVFLGETSPRYSIFCQPFLALLGASALAGFDRGGRRNFPAHMWRSLVLRGAVVVGGLALVLGVLAAGVRLVPTVRLYADVQQGWTSGSGTPVSGVVAPGAYRPFEVRLLLPPESPSSQVVWQLSPRSGSANTVSLYVLAAEGEVDAARLTIGSAGKTITSLSLDDVTEPRFLSMDLPSGAESLVFTLESAPGAPRAGMGVQIGYVTFSERSPSE